MPLYKIKQFNKEDDPVASIVDLLAERECGEWSSTKLEADCDDTLKVPNHTL